MGAVCFVACIISLVVLYHSGTGGMPLLESRFLISSKALSDWKTSGLGVSCVTPDACALPHVPARLLVA